MDSSATQIAAIRELFDAAESREMPLWLENGWAIDARLGRITRPHDDIDVAFPKDRENEYRELIASLGYRDSEFFDYGFLSWRGQVCIDSEPCHPVTGGGYSFEPHPQFFNGLNPKLPPDHRRRILIRAISHGFMPR